MIDLAISHDNLPSRKELADQLLESATPIDGLLSLYERMYLFEKEYGVSSGEFMIRFAGGEWDDDPELIQWIGLCHVAEILRLRIQAALCQVCLP
jgi:hypothetical protein